MAEVDLPDLFRLISRQDKKPEKALTIKEKVEASKFVNAFMDAGCNTTAAAKKLWPGVKNHYQRGQVMMKKPHVQALMKEIVGDLIQSSKDGKVQAVSFLKSIINSSVFDLYGEDGNLLEVRDLKALPRNIQKCIQSFTTATRVDDEGRETQVVRSMICDKIAAVRELAKIEKWADTHEKKDSVNLSLIISSVSHATNSAQQIRREIIESEYTIHDDERTT